MVFLHEGDMATRTPRTPRTPRARPRVGSIDGRQVVVLDDVISKSKVDKLTLALKEAPFRRSEYARPDTRELRHWAVDLRQIGAALCDPFVEVTAREVERYFGPGRDLHRAYCNVALFGDMLVTHTDSAPEANLVTALWYICTDWDAEWGGETLFFDQHKDAALVVSPRPGRVVLFDGAIPHVGRPPNRICYEPRFSVAIKFRPPAGKRDHAPQATSKRGPRPAR